MKDNNLKQVSIATEVLSFIIHTKSMQFLGSSVVKAEKYCDYAVILSKAPCIIVAVVEEFDSVKIFLSKPNTGQTILS
jgi:hypothetical protein